MTEMNQIVKTYRSAIYLKLDNGLLFDSTDFLSQWGAGEYKFNPDFEKEYMNKEALNNCTIFIPYATFETIEKALVLTEFLKNMFVKIRKTLIGYVSYSRQDRSTLTEPQLCHFIINLISMLTNPAIIDMHNEKSLDLFNIEKLSAAQMFYNLATSLDSLAIIIAPDKGAAERLKAHGVIVDGYLNKTRNNNRVSTTIDNDVKQDIEDKIKVIKGLCKRPKFFIIDDICDGGRTFVEAVNCLQKLENAYYNADYYLMVSHAILPFGVDNLKSKIDKIYTLATAQPLSDDYITVINLNEILYEFL